MISNGFVTQSKQALCLNSNEWNTMCYVLIVVPLLWYELSIYYGFIRENKDPSGGATITEQPQEEGKTEDEEEKVPFALSIFLDHYSHKHKKILWNNKIVNKLSITKHSKPWQDSKPVYTYLSHKNLIVQKRP